MNRNIGVLFGVVAPADRAAPDRITVKMPIAEHSSIGFELRFPSLVRGGRVLAFPCDQQGRVDLNAVSDRVRNDYLFARAMVGREYAVPVVQQPIGRAHLSGSCQPLGTAFTARTPAEAMTALGRGCVETRLLDPSVVPDAEANGFGCRVPA